MLSLIIASNTQVLLKCNENEDILTVYFRPNLILFRIKTFLLLLNMKRTTFLQMASFYHF